MKMKNTRILELYCNIERLSKKIVLEKFNIPNLMFFYGWSNIC